MAKYFTRFVCVFLVGCISLILVAPPVARAQQFNLGLGDIAGIAGGVLGEIATVSGLCFGGKAAATGIGGLIGGLGASGAVPVSAEDAVSKDCILDGVGTRVKDKILANLVEGIEDWAARGFEGKPFFIEDPSKLGELLLGHYLDSLVGEGGFIGTLVETLCYNISPLQIEVRLGLSTTNAPRPNCTIGRIGENIDDFREGTIGEFSDWRNIFGSPRYNPSLAEANAVAAVLEEFEQQSQRVKEVTEEDYLPAYDPACVARIQSDISSVSLIDRESVLRHRLLVLEECPRVQSSDQVRDIIDGTDEIELGTIENIDSFEEVVGAVLDALISGTFQYVSEGARSGFTSSVLARTERDNNRATSYRAEREQALSDIEEAFRFRALSVERYKLAYEERKNFLEAMSADLGEFTKRCVLTGLNRNYGLKRSTIASGLSFLNANKRTVGVEETITIRGSQLRFSGDLRSVIEILEEAEEEALDVLDDVDDILDDLQDAFGHAQNDIARADDRNEIEEERDAFVRRSKEIAQLTYKERKTDIIPSLLGEVYETGESGTDITPAIINAELLATRKFVYDAYPLFGDRLVSYFDRLRRSSGCARQAKHYQVLYTNYFGGGAPPSIGEEAWADFFTSFDSRFNDVRNEYENL